MKVGPDRHFSNLGEGQIRILGFSSWCRRSPSEEDWKAFRGHFSLGLDSFEDDVTVLSDLGLYSNIGGTAAAIDYLVVMEIAAFFPHWIDDYRQIKPMKDDSLGKRIWDACEVFLSKGETTDYPFKSYMARGFIEDEAYWPLIRDEAEKYACVSYFIERKLSDDSLTLGDLDALERFISMASYYDITTFGAFNVRFCRYMMTGAPIPQKKGCEEISLGYQGIVKLLDGSVTEAVECFERYFKGTHKMYRCLNPLVEYFYCIAILRCGGSRRCAIGAFKGSTPSSLAPLVRKAGGMIRVPLQGGDNLAPKALDRQLAFLVGSICHHEVVPPISMPSIPLIRLECAPYMDIPDDELDALERMFHAKGASSSITDGNQSSPAGLLSGIDLRDGEVSLSVGKPSLQFVLSNGRIKVYSNAAPGGEMKSVSVVMDSISTARIITLSEGQKKFLRSVLLDEGFPASQRDELMEMARKVSDSFDVDFDQLHKIISIPVMPADGRIFCRIDPQKKLSAGRYDRFTVSLNVMPVPGSPIALCPGQKSDELIYDSTMDVFRRRDIDKEQQRYSRFLSFIEGLPLKSSDPRRALFTIDRLETMLCVLEFFNASRDDFIPVWPEDRMLRVAGTASVSQWDLTLDREGGWFNVEGKVSIGDMVISLSALEDALEGNPNGNYIYLGEGEYARVTSALRSQIRQLNGLCEKKDGAFMTPPFLVGELAAIFSDVPDKPQIHGDEFNTILSSMKKAFSVDTDVPKELDATLRDYQVEGYKWLCRLYNWGAGACLADDMGLGKTVQTIALLLYGADRGPSLVVAPTSVVENWKSEMERFAPTLKPMVLNSCKDREKVISNAGNGDVILFTYGILQRDGAMLSKREWNIICLDEAHQVKNRWTKTSRSLMKLSSKGRVMLTGTPVQNSLADLWNLFQFLNPGLLGDFDFFRGKYLGGVEQPLSRKRLRAQTRPFILRRTKDDVLRELPTKTIVDIDVFMEDGERKVYEMQREILRVKFSKLKQDHIQKDKLDDYRISFFAGLTKLRLASCSLSLIGDWTGCESKTDRLMQLLSDPQTRESSVIIFSQFTSFLDIIKARLRSAGIPFLYMDGQTTLPRRGEIVKMFQGGEVKVFLLSLKAGGLGLNLTRASKVFLLDPWWNPAVEDQAIDRAYRIGQEKDVTIYRLISRNTIEEKILRMQERKSKLAKDILSGTGQGASLTFEEILELLS